MVLGGLSNKQNAQINSLLAPTPVSSDDLRVFPGDLVCDKREKSDTDNGPSWMGITVGQSTLDDVKQLLLTFSDKYEFIDNDNSDIRFINPNSVTSATEIPSSVRLCLTGNTVQVLAISYLLVPRPNLSDLVAEYGEPDAITWTDNPASRIAFWFQKGIAAEVTVLPNELGYQPTFGRVDTEIYFPYQELKDYKNRWPYNQTRQFNHFLAWPYEGRDDYGPENPFDFNAIIATITAQPSQTPTPITTPLTITATATP